jgi:hypothetical protein
MDDSYTERINVTGRFSSLMSGHCLASECFMRRTVACGLSLRSFACIGGNLLSSLDSWVTLSCRIEILWRKNMPRTCVVCHIRIDGAAKAE